MFNIHKPKNVVLPPEHGVALFSEVCHDLTIEHGGVLIGKFKNQSAIITEIIPIDNVGDGWDYIPEPNTWFKHAMRTSLLNKTAKVDYIGYFHSHPNGKAIPSQYDVSRANYHSVWLIISPNEMDIRPWWWDGSGFEELMLNQRPIMNNFRVEQFRRLDEGNWHLKCKPQLLEQVG